MKTTWALTKEQIFTALEAALKKLKFKVKKGELANSVEEPPSGKMGDLACSISFSIGKKIRKSPREIAEQILATVKKPSLVKKVALAGAYVNFFLNRGNFAKSVANEAIKEDFGRGSKKKERIMVEYSTPNPLKAFHIGHIRGTAIGESLSRVLKFDGYDVVQANYFNDLGTHVAKGLWCYTKFHKNEAPKENKGEWLGKIYAEANKKLADNPDYEKEVSEIQKKLESRKYPELDEIWKELKKWSVDEFHNIYKELNANFDQEFYESDLESRGREIVQELQKKKIAKKSAGAVIVDLKKHGLDIFLLLKSDGTSLYSTKDLALAEVKFKKFKIDKSIYVVGSEQRLYFQQLFKTLGLMGFKKAKNCFHLAFDLIALQSGKMSSREGTAILYSELRDRMLKKALAEVTSRNPEMDMAKQKQIAAQIGMGAIKFSILNISSTKTIFFDPQRAIEFEGETGPYIQYAGVRAKRILEKVKEMPKIREAKFNLLQTDEEHELIKHIAKFPLVVEEAATHYKVNTVATYTYKLAEKFNHFYNNLPVLNAGEKDLKEARIALVSSAFNVLKNCLYLLGIEIPGRM